MIHRLFLLALQAPEILGALSRANRAVLIDGMDPYKTDWQFAKSVMRNHILYGDEVAEWTKRKLAIPSLAHRLRDYPETPGKEHVTTFAGLIDWAFEDRDLRRLRLIPVYNGIAEEKRREKWRKHDTKGVRVHHRDGHIERL